MDGLYLSLSKVCFCLQGGSTCVYDQAVGGVVPCLCTSGREGDFCEQDIDGCSTTPCYQGVSHKQKIHSRGKL